MLFVNHHLEVMSYEGNLLKPKVGNNLRLIAPNLIKNIYGIDWIMMKRVCGYQECASKTAYVTGECFQMFLY